MPESATNPVRSLADDLRGWTASDLDWLLSARPDLKNPIPLDVRELALRAGSPHSVHRALDDLTKSELAMLEAMAALGEPVDGAQLATTTGLTIVDATEILTRLHKLALVWGQGRFHLLRAVADSFGSYPCGLAPAMAHARPALRKFEREPALVHELIAGLSLDARNTFNTLLADGPTSAYPGATRLADDDNSENPYAELVRLGLIQILDEHTVILPREVALALRGQIIVNLPSAEVEYWTADVNRDATAVQQVFQSLGLMSRMLAYLNEQPVKLGRHQVPHRPDMTRLAAYLQADADTTLLYLLSAIAANLVGRAQEPQECLATTSAGRAWRNQQPVARWSAVAEAVLRNAGAILCAMQRSSLDRLALPDAEVSRLDQLTKAWLAGCAAFVQSAAGEAFTWFRPRMSAHADSLAAVRMLTAEFGLEVAGTCSTFGKAFFELGSLEGSDELLGAIGPEIDFFYLQPDHTVIVPGLPTQSLRAELSRIGEIESEDRAIVFRLTSASLRAALQSGYTPVAVLDLLAKGSRTGVPQSLEYLLNDLGKRARSARVVDSQVIVTFTSPEDVAAARRALADQHLPCTKLNETTVSSSAKPALVTAALTTAGFTLSGSAAEPIAKRKLATSVESLWEGRQTSPDSATIAAVLIGRFAASPMPDLHPVDTATLSDSLACAIAEQSVITLQFAQSAQAQELITGIVIHTADGFVTIFDTQRRLVRTVALSRVTAISQ